MHIPLRVGALALALCAIVAGGLVVALLARPSHAAKHPFGDCRVYRDGSDLSIRAVGPDAGDVCTAWVRGRSNASEFWTPRGTPPTDEASALICTLEYGAVTLNVFDRGGATGGREVCGELVGRGWTEL